MSEEVRAIRESEYEECLNLWLTVWSGDMRGYFVRYFYGDQNFQNDYTRVCVVDGRIVSAVQIVKRTVAWGDCVLTMGGIANVGTLPEYQRRGYSGRCLQQAIEVMEADAMDISVLFTGTHHHYARYGWETIPYFSAGGRIRSGFQPSEIPVTVRPYEAGDDEAIYAIYAAFNRTRPITVRRGAPYWRDWVEWSGGKAPGEARVAVVDGRIAGYLLFEHRKDDTELKEIGGSDAALAALIETAAEESLARGIDRLTITLPCTPAIYAIAVSLFEELELRPQNHTMARVLSRDGLLRGLLPELTERWAQAGSPEGSLRFMTPYGAVRLRSAGTLLAVEPVDAAEGALSQADMMSLLIGVKAPSVQIPSDQERFASAVFPTLESWYWPLDGF